jgi:putative ABC transport system permease protein
VADAVLWRPLPYPDSNRLVMVWDQLWNLHVNELPLSGVTFDAYRSDRNVFEAAAAFRVEGHNLTGSGDAERVALVASTDGLLEMLGARPALGRAFAPQDYQAGHETVALLSYPLFARHFGSDPGILGRTIRLDDRAYTVAGVMPPGFDFGPRTGGADLWTPLPPISGERMWQFRMLARLRPGVGVEAAQASATAAARHVEETLHPYRGPKGEDAGYHAKVVSLHDQLLHDYRTGTLILLSAVVLVLLIACVNIANLLLVRAAAREKEIAVQRALGASGWRLIRQWMTESLVLAFFGGLLGTLTGVWGVRILSLLYPYSLPEAVRIAVNGRALLFTLAISVVVCLLFGIAPALVATRTPTLRGPRARRWTASALVTAEVALALLRLIGAGLLLKSFVHLREVNPGFRSDHLLTMEIPLAGAGYETPANAPRRIQFYSGLQEKLAALPGVISASSVSRLPVFGADANALGGNPFSIEGQPWNPSGATPQIMHDQVVGLDYFRTMQIALRAGRVFTPADTFESGRVAIVNETLARGFFPRGNSIGQRILIGAPYPGAQWMTIVGIVADVKTASLSQKTLPQLYRPYPQYPFPAMTLVLRTPDDPLKMTRTVMGILKMIDPGVPVDHIQTMDQVVDRSMGQQRFQTALLAFFAATALLLAGVGIYGVVAYATIQRTREIGIRMALGADATRVIRTVLASGLRPILIGTALGLAGALAFSRLLASVLFEVTPRDPATLAAAPVILGIIATVACLGPAQRAARVDPQTALRVE